VTGQFAFVINLQAPDADVAYAGNGNPQGIEPGAEGFVNPLADKKNNRCRILCHLEPDYPWESL
jgi:hypothetical protein